MSIVKEEAGLDIPDSATIESPPPEPIEPTENLSVQTDARECTSPTTVQKTTDSWFRRTIISRFLSTAMPGMDGIILSDEPTSPPIINGIEALPNCPEEEDRILNGGLLSDPALPDVSSYFLVI